jgi:hypothetical protein
MEAEVFLLGNWKDYNQMEEELSMPELLLTLEAQRKVKWRDYKFHAAMQGVSLPDDESKDEPTFEDIQRRAALRAMGADPDANDIKDMRGTLADEVGFGVNVEGGLNYSTE